MATLRRDQVMVAQEMVERGASIRQVARQLGVAESGLRYRLKRRPDAPDGRRHAFDAACERLGVEHRLTKPAHPWTNGQVERMNRTIKDATVRRYHYDTHGQLREHLQLFLDAYNYARRLKSLRGLTPYEFICKAWAEEPHRFTRDPTHDTLGPNI